MADIKNCEKFPYRDLYDQYSTYSFFGGLEEYFFDPVDANIRAERLNKGFVVNKQFDKIVKWQSPKNRLHFRTFDWIRLTEEVLAGIFSCEDEEFSLIFPRFIKEFMMNSVYILYSPEFRDFELALAAKLSREENQDPYDRIERAIPNSAYRLLKRTTDDSGNYKWDCILSNVKDVKIDEFLPQIGNQLQQPIRFSFNEGFFFIRLFDIFRRYEAQMQTHYKLFHSIHTVGEIKAENQEAIDNKRIELQGAEMFPGTMTDDIDNICTIVDFKLVDKMPMLTESYQNIQLLLNDSLAKLGLATDDATKTERITVGENTRALQPTMNFQNAVMGRLNLVTYRMQLHFGKTIKFINMAEQREARMNNMNNSPFNKYKDNDIS